MLRTITNGSLDAFSPMLDTDGNPINASDGGIIYAGGKYHWYGLRLRPLPIASSGKGGQVTDTGVIMYASDDLVSWYYEGVILSCSSENCLLRATMRFERPKILYNKCTGKYVLWCHYVAYPGDHGFTLGTAEAGIAVCDTVNGQYEFLGTCRPIDGKGLVRDCTLFQDDDGVASFIYDRHAGTEFHPVHQPFERCLHIVRLSDDYLSPTNDFIRIDAADAREAPCLIKHNGKYYMITSGFTGWANNQARYYMANSIMGHWCDMGDPCTGNDEYTTFRSQGTYIFTVQKHTPIFMCERHNTTDFSHCGHIWLPLRFNPDNTLRRCARNGDICVGTIDSYLIYRLTEGRTFATDLTNASRTQLFDIHTRTFDLNLTRLFEIPESCIPEVLPSDACFGYTSANGVPVGIPIVGVMGDSHASLFGQNCLTEGSIKTTYGTGSSVMMNTGRQPFSSGRGLSTSIAYGFNGRVDYVLEGNITHSGDTLAWLCGQAGMAASPAEVEALAQSVPNAGGVYLVPAFAGMGAPYFDETARAAFIGINRSTTRAHMLRAALESMAYQNADVILEMTRLSGRAADCVHADGGGCKNETLMQMQADLLGCRIDAISETEASALGAAYMAGFATGLFTRETVVRPPMRRFEPIMDAQTRSAHMEQGIKYTLTTRHTCPVDGDEFKNDVERFARICAVVKALRNARVAQIGARVMPFRTVRYSEKLLQKSGITIETEDFSEILADIARLHDDVRIQEKVEEIRASVSLSIAVTPAIKERYLSGIGGIQYFL